jgi:hypothetical protein
MRDAMSLRGMAAGFAVAVGCGVAVGNAVIVGDGVAVSVGIGVLVAGIGEGVLVAVAVLSMVAVFGMAVFTVVETLVLSSVETAVSATTSSPTTSCSLPQATNKNRLDNRTKDINRFITQSLLRTNNYFGYTFWATQRVAPTIFAP